MRVTVTMILMFICAHLSVHTLNTYLYTLSVGLAVDYAMISNTKRVL